MQAPETEWCPGANVAYFMYQTQACTKFRNIFMNLAKCEQIQNFAFECEYKIFAKNYH